MKREQLSKIMVAKSTSVLQQNIPFLT